MLFIDFARTPRAPKSAEAAKKRTEMNLQKGM